MRILKKDESGNWTSYFPIRIKVKRVENVAVTAQNLVNYLKNQNFPFNCNKIEVRLEEEMANEKLEREFRIAYVLLFIKKKSLLSRLNPWHSEINGDESIVIEIRKGSNLLSLYQEYKYDYSGTFTWKISLEQIRTLVSLLEKFVKARTKSFNPSVA